MICKQCSNETYDSLKSGIQRLIDIGQKDFLMVHPLVITYNATMGQPWYQEKYKMDTKEVPLDTFYLSVDELEDYIVEKTCNVVETSYLNNKEDVLRGNIVSHLLIVFYYYGWGHYLLEYLNNKFGYKHLDVVEKLLSYFENKSDTIIGKKYKKLKNF